MIRSATGDEEKTITNIFKAEEESVAIGIGLMFDQKC